MKILLVSSSSGSRGGGEIFLVYLAAALSELGHSPSLWCSSHTRMDELVEAFSKHGDVIRFDYPNSYFERKTRAFGAWMDQKLSQKIAAHWSSLDVDTVHLNLQTPEDGLDLVRALHHTPHPSLITTHITQTAASLGAKGGSFRDFVTRRAYQTHPKTIPIIAVSDSRAKDLKKTIKDARIEVIYNGVTPSTKTNFSRKQFLEEQGWPDDSFVVTDVARLTAQKNPLAFIRYAEKILERIPRSRFVWVGDGPMREEFLAAAGQTPIKDRIHVTGWSDTPASYLAASDLYLHPARFEGLPLAILEAMQAGVPCLLPQSIIDEAYVLDNSNTISLDSENEWLEIISSEDQLRSINEQAQAAFKRHFTHLEMARQYTQLYQELSS